MMQVQLTNRTMSKPQPTNWRIAGTLALVAGATIAANALMALGWSHLLNGDAWLVQAAAWMRLVWMLGFGTLMVINNALAVLAVWGWARRVQQQTAMRSLVRWAGKQNDTQISRNFPFVALPAAVLLAPALLLLI